MTNPGSLTMGFAGVDPRQLAPSVGTTQVGITISAVPSSASHNSRARTRSSPLEGFKITTNISATPSRSLGLQLCQDDTTVTAKCSVSNEGIDDPEERREASTKESHSTNRDAQRRTHKSFDNPPPPGHPPHIRTMSTRSKPAISRTIAKEEGIDDPKGAHGRSTARLKYTIHNNQPGTRRPRE